MDVAWNLSALSRFANTAEGREVGGNHRYIGGNHSAEKASRQ